MTLLYCTGYEHGLATLSGSGTGMATTIVGSPTVQNSTKRTGDYALSCSAASYTKALTSNAVVTVRFSIYFSSVNTTTTSEIMRLSGTITSCYLYYEGTSGANQGKLFFYSSGATTRYSASAVSTGQWYDIDIKLDGTNKTIDWQIDGTAQTQFSGWTSAGAVTLMRLGASNATDTFLFDDVVVTNSGSDYPLGDCEVVGLRPTTDGSYSAVGTNVIEDEDGHDIAAGNPAYELIDDTPWTSTANDDCIRQYATGTGNYAEVNFADTTQTDILGAIAVLQYAASGTTTNEGACVIIDEDTTATTVWGSAASRADYSETTAFYKSAILPIPAGTWDQTAVNALTARMGYSNNVATYPYWLALIIEVAYRPSSDTPLTMASAAHTLACDNITLTQVHTLAMQSAAFTEESSAPTLNELRTLAMDAAAFVLTASSPVLETSEGTNTTLQITGEPAIA